MALEFLQRIFIYMSVEEKKKLIYFYIFFQQDSYLAQRYSVPS